MLKQRVLTAVVLVPLVVALVGFAPLLWLAAALAALMMVAAWEWAGLAGYTRPPARLLYCLLTAVALLLTAWLAHTQSPEATLWIVCGLGLGWWLFALLWVSRWRYALPQPLKALGGWLTLVPAWLAVLGLRAQRPALLLLLLALIWAADIGAYFAGRAFGRHKLAPAVSPGKTWEGVGGGTLALLAVSALASRWLLPQAGPLLIPICLLSGWFSIVGDLSESLFKRQAGVKDSGRLFPGHGGVLDRIDSLSAAAPVFWLGLAVAGVRA